MPLELVQPGANSSPPSMVAEANHRIANSLSVIASLVRMRGASICKKPHRISGEEIRLILEELSGRLETVARLHRLLASGQREASIDISDYLREVAEGIVSSLSFAGQTELELALDAGCFVSPERALPVGLIVAELISNAVKYAHPTGVAGQIRLACRIRSDGTITIEISDDGVGLPEGVDPMRNGHLGFRLVRSLADQLGAAIAFHSDGLGLCFEMHMARPTN